MNTERFYDRKSAGQELADTLIQYQYGSVIVAALPRGGVIEGAEVAEALHAPLELIFTRKIGHPFNPEFAVAAVSEHGITELSSNNHSLTKESWFKSAIRRKINEARAMHRKYAPWMRNASLKDKTVIIVDDGIATGLNIKVAIAEAKAQHPHAVIVAAPVAPLSVIKMLQPLVDDIIVVEQPTVFLGSVGAYYEHFDQVSHDQVINTLYRLHSGRLHGQPQMHPTYQPLIGQ